MCLWTGSGGVDICRDALGPATASVALQVLSHGLVQAALFVDERLDMSGAATLSLLGRDQFVGALRQLGSERLQRGSERGLVGRGRCAPETVASVHTSQS